MCQSCQWRVYEAVAKLRPDSIRQQTQRELGELTSNSQELSWATQAKGGKVLNRGWTRVPGQVEFCLSNRNLPGKTLGSTSNFPLAIFPLTLAAFYRCCRYFLSLTSFSYNLPQLTRCFRLQHFAEAPLISLFPLLLPRPHPQFIKSKQQYEEKRRLSQNGFHSLLLLRLLLLCLLLITLLQAVRLVAAFSAN